MRFSRLSPLLTLLLGVGGSALAEKPSADAPRSEVRQFAVASMAQTPSRFLPTPEVAPPAIQGSDMFRLTPLERAKLRQQLREQRVSGRDPLP